MKALVAGSNWMFRVLLAALLIILVLLLGAMGG